MRYEEFFESVFPFAPAVAGHLDANTSDKLSFFKKTLRHADAKRAAGFGDVNANLKSTELSNENLKHIPVALYKICAQVHDRTQFFERRHHETPVNLIDLFCILLPERFWSETLEFGQRFPFEITDRILTGMSGSQNIDKIDARSIKLLFFL